MAVEHQEFPETRVWYDSNWYLMYVVLVVIPLVFIGIALWSRRQDRMARQATDVEMAAHGPNHDRVWFPWRDGPDPSSSSSTSSAPPPVVPASFTARPLHSDAHGSTGAGIPVRSSFEVVAQEASGRYTSVNHGDSIEQKMPELAVREEQRPLPYATSGVQQGSYCHGYGAPRPENGEGMDSRRSSRYSQDHFQEIEI
ncbi:hypothetical protein F4778DRAFT_36563 [Xylariomycetidae sp. FL2044]|nr:hypothetical protein F4778DRAFT_36563 [Xylariomycetidae sp. FL2044]